MQQGVLLVVGLCPVFFLLLLGVCMPGFFGFCCPLLGFVVSASEPPVFLDDRRDVVTARLAVPSRLFQSFCEEILGWIKFMHNPSFAYFASIGMINAEEKEESLLPSRVGARVAALEAKQNASPSQPQSPADSNSGSEGSRSAYGSGTPGGGGKIRDMLNRLQSVEGQVILVKEGVCNAPHHKGAGNLLCPMAGKIKISVNSVERLVCSKHAKKPPNFLLPTGWYAVEPEGLERNTEATADHFTRFNPNHKGAEYILNVFELSAEAEAAMEAIAQPLDLSKLPAVPAPAKAAGKSSGAVMVGQPAAGAGGVKTATNISGGNNGISDPLLVGVMGGNGRGSRWPLNRDGACGASATTPGSKQLEQGPRSEFARSFRGGSGGHVWAGVHGAGRNYG